MAEMIEVEVAYALPDKQAIVRLQVAQGTTAREAVRLSNIAQDFVGLDVEQAKLGIFSKALAKPDEEVLSAGDRVEIYRPLLIDPKQARLNRAAKKASD